MSIPRIAAFFARGAKGDLFVLVLFRLRIGVGRCELDLRAVRPEERARGLADSRRDALGLARCHVEHIDLVERIPRLTLTLKNDSLAVRGPVPFARATPFDRQAADARE
jgi:hypothetical protein